MYPKILFFVLGLFFPLWASAQELYRSLNIQACVNLSKIRYYDRLTSSDFVVRPSLELTAEFPFCSMMSVSGGIGFTQKGYYEANSFQREDGEEVDLRVISSYFTVTVQLHLYPLRHNNFDVQVGLLHSFLLKRRFDFIPEMDAPCGTARVYDLAISAGLAYHFRYLSVGIDYQYGLLPTYKGSGFNDRTWHFSLGYKIPLRKR